MKRVKYLSSMGMSHGPGIAAGEVLDVEDDEADRLIAGDLAVEDDGELTEAAASGDESGKAPEPFGGYEDAKADEIIEKVEDGELSLSELLALQRAEASGKDRSTVLAAVEEKLDAAAAAVGPPPEVTVPDDVVPGETPGWPIVNGEVIHLPDQVREELAAIPIQEVDVEETRGGSTKDGATTESAKAGQAETTSSKKAGSASTKASKKAATAKKRS